MQTPEQITQEIEAQCGFTRTENPRLIIELLAQKLAFRDESSRLHKERVKALEAQLKGETDPFAVKVED